MGYRNTVANNVDKAFKLLKDLAVNVTLSSTRDGGFDFATNAPAAPTVTSKVIQAVPTTKRRQPGQEPATALQHSFIFKAKDLPDPTIYDTITVIGSGETWKVVQPYDNDGYIVTVNVARNA